MTELANRLKQIENALERHQKDLVALRERSGRDWEEMYAVVDRRASEGGGGTMDYIADFDEGSAIQAARSAHANLLLALDGSGEFPDSVIKESNVTQHEAALSITAGQVSGLDYYTDADVDAHLSGGDGINYSTGSIAVDGTVLRHTDVDDTPVNSETTVPVSSNWAYDHAANAAAHHNAVTLSADLNSNLLALSTQELDLDTQSANTIFAGPSSGAAAKPTFRSLVTDDLPAHASLHESGGGDAVNHDSLTGFVGNEHIDHTSVSVSAGGILSGGGTIAANRTISLAHGDVDHDQTANFATDEHVAHSGVTLTAGNGLTGGGTIAASRTFAVGAGNGISVAADSVAVNQAFAFTWTGEHEFQDIVYTSNVIPRATDTYDLGSSSRLWRKGWLSELDTVLYAQNSIQVTGGWWMIPHSSGSLAEDVDGSETQIDFGSALTTGDFIILRGNGQVEYMTVGSLVGGTTYNVTRNVDGSGANTWPQGHAWVNLGQSGDGRIEFDAQTQGPRILVITQGATYNAQTDIAVLGDLNGWGPYSSTTYGFAFGDYSGGDYISWDPTNGVVIAADGSGITNIDGGNIQALSIDTAQLAADCITAAKIDALAVDTEHLAADCVTTAKIDAGAVTATEINVATLSAITADMGTLTTGEIRMYSGTWDSTATGFRLNSTEIAGQNSGTDQVRISATDGKLYAAGGNVVLDEDGIGLTRQSSTWVSDASITWGSENLSIFGARWNSDTYKSLSLKAVGTAHGGVTILGKRDYGATDGYGEMVLLGESTDGLATITAVGYGYGTAYVDVRSYSGGTRVRISPDLRVLNGLWVGSDNDPDDNDIHYDGDLHPVRGGTSYTGQILIDSNTDTAGSNLTLTTSFQDFISDTVTVPTGGGTISIVAAINVTCTTFSSGTGIDVKLLVDGVQKFYTITSLMTNYDYETVPITWVGAISAGSKVVKIQVKKSGGTNNATANTGYSAMAWQLFV